MQEVSSRYRENPMKQQKPKEGYERSSHNDFATTKELIDREFSGLRHNNITNRMEVWILGGMAAETDFINFKERNTIWQEIETRLFG